MLQQQSRNIANNDVPSQMMHMTSQVSQQQMDYMDRNHSSINKQQHQHQRQQEASSQHTTIEITMATTFHHLCNGNKYVVAIMQLVTQGK